MTNLYSYYLQVLFLSFIIIDHLTEIYLHRRQLKHFKENQHTPPPEFAHTISIEDHQKAIAYGTAKLQFSIAHLVFDMVLMLYWFPMRGAEKLFTLIPLSGIHHDVIFICAFSLIQILLNLPWSAFSTFYLEDKFGFNKSTPQLFILDRIKGLTLGTLIGIPLLYAVIALYNSLETWWWVVTFLLMIGFQFFLIWIYPTIIAPLFNKFSPLESTELKNGIEKLVEQAGFSAKEIFIMDASRRSSHGNAYFTGFGKNKRVVFFDTLLKQLGHAEIMAILAHELGHMKLKHIPKSLALSMIGIFISFWLMGKLSTEAWFFNGHFFRQSSPGILILLFTQAIPLYTFWFSPIFSWISRKREFEADAYAAKETNPVYLIQGLLKLYQQNASPVVSDKVYSTFYHSHPPAFERIKRLESFKSETREGLS